MSLSIERIETFFSKINDLDPLLVIGDVGIDRYTRGRVSRISPEAPVPVVEVDKTWEKLGLAANVTDNLKSLDFDSILCGVVGEDAHGVQLEKLLDDINVKTWGIVPLDKRMTVYKERVVAENQQICRVDYETTQSLSDSEKDRFFNRIQEITKDASGMVLEDYAKGLFDKELVESLIKMAKSKNKPIYVDPSRVNPVSWYRGATLLKPNRIEAEILLKKLGYESCSIEEMTKILLNELELKQVVITLGAEGMAMRESDFSFEIIPTFARDVFDVSGAGDTAISILSLMLLTGAKLSEACYLANCASAIVVGKRGTATVSRQEILDFVANS